MDTSKRTHKARTGGRRAPRRATCPSTPAKHDTAGLSDALKLTVRITPLTGLESNALRVQQLTVIVKLLRRAAVEAREG
jgi:hypothetical protein